MPLPSRLVAFSAAALLSLAALTGCSAPGNGEQSTADACGVLAEGLGNVQDQVTAADAALTDGDLAAARANLAGASAGLFSVKPQLTNPEIAPILEDLIAGMNGIITTITDVDVADPAALQASTDGLRTVVDRFNTACGG